MRMPQETRIEDMVVGPHSRCSIMCAVLTLGMVPIEWVVGFGRMQMPINGQVFQHIIKGKEVGIARDMAVQHVMEIPKGDRPKWLFFLGDDMIPPWDGFVRLYEEAELNKWDCLTGMYFWKGEPPTPLIWRNDHIGRMVPGRDFKVGDVVWCDMTGLDFTLIRVSMLERIQEELGGPFFKTGPTKRAVMPFDLKGPDDGSILMHTEDVWFYSKVRALGGKIGVHTGVRVSHINSKTGMIY